MTDILPNCLTKEPKVDSRLDKAGNWFYLFCANCGKDGGRVQDTLLPKQFAFYLCNPCAEKYGAVAGTYMEPDAVFWEKVKQAQLEKFGRELEPVEVVEALKDENHILSKLARERNA